MGFNSGFKGLNCREELSAISRTALMETNWTM